MNYELLDLKLAKRVATILERVTGDKCMVIAHGLKGWAIQRDSGTKVVEG